MLTLKNLTDIMPHLPLAKAQLYLPYLQSAFVEFEVNTVARLAAMLAQVAHESAEFRYMEEIASGAAYEGRQDLGNTQPGEGVRYKGRGPIQLTGRLNYHKAGIALGLDLENHPETAKNPDVAFRTAGWFWKSHGLNELADAGNFDAITHRINGGWNGKTQRDAYHVRALSVLAPQIA